MTTPSFDRGPGAGRGGSIYDLGYRGYEGLRLGRRGAITALLTHSVRTAYGLGRNARSKIVPVGLLGPRGPALAAGAGPADAGLHAGHPG